MSNYNSFAIKNDKILNIYKLLILIFPALIVGGNLFSNGVVVLSIPIFFYLLFKKRHLNLKQLLLNFFGYPLMTAKIISAIHYEAFILWFKGAIYRSRKRKIKIGLSYEGKK